MTDKPSIIIEIENFLNIKLIREQNVVRSMGILRRNSYVLNSVNEIIGLNLQKITIQRFPFFRDLDGITHLNLSNTELFEIDFINLLPKLEYLNLSSNHIFNIESLVSLKNLKHLNLFNNKIIELEIFSELNNIVQLNLSSNQIRDISPLINLKNLTHLDLSDNAISNLSVLDELEMLRELKLSKNNITEFPFLPNLTNLKILNLNSNGLENIYGIENYTNLKTLNISRNSIYSIEYLNSLISVEFLFIQDNKIEDLSPLAELLNLRYLNASQNRIDHFYLPNLSKLTRLNLSENPLRELYFEYNRRIQILNLNNTQFSTVYQIENLKNLKSLSLSGNSLVQINFLSELSKLSILDISYNNIDDISPLRKLPLKELNISHNPIENIDSLIPIVNDNSLQYLSLSDTIFEKLNNLELPKRENHIAILKNRLLIYNSDGEISEGYYPVKVLLLGNHRSGKSQFLSYFLTGKLVEESKTTDIIQIELYRDIKSSILPTAIFYDFGGQDFYHGLYRIFLSKQSIHCLFWHEKSNSNKYEIDVNKNPIQNFNVDYWIGQKKYNEHYEEFNDDLFLIETHSDVKASKRPTYFTFNQIEKIPRQQFYISLRYHEEGTTTLNRQQIVNLDHLKSNLLALIEEKRIPFQQKIWYLNFIKHITSKQRKEQATDIIDLVNFFEDLNTSEDLKIELLKTELDQLHRKGLVLYYKDEIPDFVWLNPLKIVNYIKEKVLIFKDIQEARGTLNAKYFEDKNIDLNILSLLKFQKVIFLHEYGLNDNGEIVQEYIIPNYLPLVSKKNDFEYDLFTFGIHKQHIFTLKFTDFIPLGLINQLICFFGSLPDKKKFWRNQIVFTFENKCKILIFLDNENLEIKVYSHFLISDNEIKEKIIRYIYSCILCFYWDIKLVTFKDYLDYLEQLILNEKDGFDSDLKIKYAASEDFYSIIDLEVPTDLFISIDGAIFVNASDLTMLNESKDTKIMTYHLINSKVQLDYPKERSVYPYKIFTNKNLKKLKKVFVSYSHANFKEMEELTKYLVGFVRNKEIESWTDLKLQSGVRVKEDILQNLEEADIVILLISQDFIASDFIYDNELQMAMQKKLTGRGEIVPVVLSSSSIFDLKLNVTGNEGNMTEIKMGDYYFSPQGPGNSLLPIEKWEHKSDAWIEVYKDIKKKINT